MRSVVFGLAASLLLGGPALAQTTGATSGGMTGPSAGGTAASPPTSGTPAVSSNRAAASGNDNQAVATTNANAAGPAHGHNSFTRGEARRRIAAEGYSQVSGLRLVQGVWQGRANKDGQTTSVWLDFKGNVGASQS